MVHRSPSPCLVAGAAAQAAIAQQQQQQSGHRFTEDGDGLVDGLVLGASAHSTRSPSLSTAAADASSTGTACAVISTSIVVMQDRSRLVMWGSLSPPLLLGCCRRRRGGGEGAEGGEEAGEMGTGGGDHARRLPWIR